MIRDIITIPLCSQVIANCKAHNWLWSGHIKGVLNGDYPLERAVDWCFPWVLSPQGDEYWRMYNYGRRMPQGLRDWN